MNTKSMEVKTTGATRGITSTRPARTHSAWANSRNGRTQGPDSSAGHPQKKPILARSPKPWPGHWGTDGKRSGTDHLEGSEARKCGNVKALANAAQASAHGKTRAS